STAAPAANVENLFYKAYWLENGPRDRAGAMVLYEQFLAQAPEHALAQKAAERQFGLLTATGKTKDAEAFAKKYEKLLGTVAVGAPASGGDNPDGQGQRGEGRRGQRGQRGGAAAADPNAAGGANLQEQIADLKKQVAEAKAAGDEE